jgi:hypothetical protein
LKNEIQNIDGGVVHSGFVFDPVAFCMVRDQVIIKFLLDKQWYDTWDQGMTYYRNIYFVVFPGVPILAMLYLYFFTRG